MSAIDPGVDDTITQEAGNITERDENDRDQQEEDDFMQPSQWWFASTACPLLAGTFGPMASGFNILALVHSWRQSLPDLTHTYEGEGHTIQDPPWVIGLNAVSLVAALIGNASLLLNMAHRLKFSIAQPITITGFLLAGVLLIADMAALTAQNAYGIQRPQFQPSHRHALTGAFYYAIFAAAIYIIIGLLMAFTVYGALRGHYKKDFHLTSSQRTLMLQTMSFITYLLLGALVYSHIEGWEYLNAVYWADVTLLTIGLGDFSPETAVGRGLLFPFAIGGVLMVGLVVGSIRSLILERGKEKLGARVMEKRRSGAVHNVDSDKKTIKISLFASADYDPEGLSPAQQREEEFRIMRKVSISRISLQTRVV
jgi:potassium channel subfamily K